MAEIDFKSMGVSPVRSHFFDSGSYSLWAMEARKWLEKKRKRMGYLCSDPGKSITDRDYYDSKPFWNYIDSYANFIKAHQGAIDYYANVDVVNEPDLTWRNQKYLENEHGLNPVPVVHYKAALKWLDHYVNRNYDYIGLGGLVGSQSKLEARHWLNKVFNRICPPPDYLPLVRLHGFGIVSYELMIRYPWFSIDSAAWAKIGGVGNILVPHKRRGVFVFDEAPYTIGVSETVSRNSQTEGKHISTLTNAERGIVMEWIQKLGMQLGGKERGLATSHWDRKMANLLFYEEMRRSLPKWPWPFLDSTKSAKFNFVS
jgi:hypothetical protein